MAHTRKGRELTEQNRKAQASIVAALVETLRSLFLDIFDVDDMDGSAKEFITKALPLVLDSRDLAYEQGYAYLDAFRRVEVRSLVDGEHAPRDDDQHALDLELLEEFLDDDGPDFFGHDPHTDLPQPDKVVADLYTSSAAVAKAKVKNGDTPEVAKQRAADAVAAKAARHVSDGGRAPLMAEVRTGGHGAVGYARVMDANPCPFCAMLGSRGAVYRSDAFESSNALFTGDNRFKVHDACECTLEPVYGRSATDLPPGNAELAQQWAEIASGQDDPFAYWRRWRESGTKPGDERSTADVESKRPSAPQYGRDRARATATRKGRKQIAEMDDPVELERTLRGMYVRRAGLQEEIADLQKRGQSIHEPGPAQAVKRQLDRLNTNIELANRKLATM